MPSAYFKITEHAVPCQHIREYPFATLNAQENVLNLAVKQYTPLDNLNPQHGDITIIGAHANGFPKELYEPLWEELLKFSKSAGFRIRNIWIADVAHQGWSSVLNESKLGNDPSWFDHPRDLLQLINHFRTDMVRPIIGVGHSMGGAHLTQLALMHPRLLETLILIDPVIQKSTSPKGNALPAQSSANRRDRWPSRIAALTAFKRSKFYQLWDPRVLDLWVKYGLRDLPTKLYPSAPPVHPYEQQEQEVTLTTTKHQEVFTFLRSALPSEPSSDFSEGEWARLKAVLYPDFGPGVWELAAGFYRPEPLTVFENIKYLRPSVFYIFGEQSNISNPTARKQKMDETGAAVGGSGGAAVGRVKQILIKDTGHLIPMEKVEETASNAGEWIESEMKRWWADEELIARRWASEPGREKYTLSEKTIEKFKQDLIGIGKKVKDTKL